MSNAIEATTGSCIDFDLVYKDEAGAVEDISGDNFAVMEAMPSALSNAVLTKADPENGVLHFHLAAVDSARLGNGKTNRFRISRIFPDACKDNSEIIWITIR